MKPKIGLLYTDDYPDETFAEFRQLVDGEGVEMFVETRENQPNAGLIYYLLTTVVIFVGAEFFKGFVSEAGKDTYKKVSNGCAGLLHKLVGGNGPNVTLIGSRGKVRGGPNFSFVVSLMAEGEGVNFKLLLPTIASEEMCSTITAAYFEFLKNYHAGSLSPLAASELSVAPAVGNTILLAYDPAVARVRPVDPISSSPN